MVTFFRNIFKLRNENDPYLGEDCNENIPFNDVVIWMTKEQKKSVEIDWTTFKKDSMMLMNGEILTINNCPSFSSAIQCFEQLDRTKFIRIKINEALSALNETQFYELMQPLKALDYFFISLASNLDDFQLFFWKIKGNPKICEMEIESNECGLGGFVSEFIMKSMENNGNGLHSGINFSDTNLTCIVTYDMISNSQNHNLLFLAAACGHSEIVKHLLQHFNVNQRIEEQIAIDFAYQARNFETVLVLLQGNSKFPKGFREDNKELPFNLRKFIVTSKHMHDAILSHDKEGASYILNQNPGLKYFFNLENQSALSKALEARSFQIYKLLIDKNISLGPHENFANIIESFSPEQREELSEINIKNCQNLKEDYILKLLANSIVGPDDEYKETRFAHVVKAFECLNKIDEVKILLKFIATIGNYQLIFDFNRDHVQFLDPKSESYVTGLFYVNGRIYIGAMHLLDEERAHEVYGTIAHEICHYVMFKVFENWAKPYAEDDINNKESFQKISEYCEVLKDFERIVGLVYECYEETYIHAELIVRIPHMFGHYHNNPERLVEIKKNLSELYRFYMEVCIKRVEEKLQNAQKEINEENPTERRQLVTKKPMPKYARHFFLSLAVLSFIWAILTCFFILKSYELIRDCSKKNDKIFLTTRQICKLKNSICQQSIVNCDLLDVLDKCRDVCFVIIAILVWTKIYLCIRYKRK